MIEVSDMIFAYWREQWESGAPETIRLLFVSDVPQAEMLANARRDFAAILYTDELRRRSPE